jgi:hypothetical protein
MFGMVGLIQAYATIRSELDLKEICDGAYQYADAMLEARKPKEPEVEEGIVAIKKRVRKS